MKSDIEADLGEVEILVNCAGGDIGASGGKPNPNNVLGIPLEDIVASRRWRHSTAPYGRPTSRC
jgi:hypothetical protein